MSHNTHLNAMRMLTLGTAISLLGAAVLTTSPSGVPTETTYTTQGVSLAGVKTAVESVGGEITHELGIINLETAIDRYVQCSSH